MVIDRPLSLYEACDGFRPVGYRPTRPGEFVNTRKFELLDRSGLFDDMEGEDK